MGDKVTLVRPDGSTFNAPVEDEEQYRALGYARETPQENYERNIEAAHEEYFTTPGQRTAAGLEGFVNGLTMGGYTSLLGGSDDEQDRARYNPGTRLGGEIVGAILPSLVPGGAEVEGGRIAKMAGTLLEHTPTGLLTRGAEGIAEATTATKTGHALIRGAVEGAAFGAQGEITNAKLSGDPVTAEAVLAGMGWGALYGGGLGHLSGKIGVHAEESIANAAAKKAAAEAAEKVGAVSEEGWSTFRSAVDDVRKTAKKTIDEAVATVKNSQEAKDTLTMAVLQHADEMEAEQKALFNRIDIKGGGRTRGAPAFKKELKQIQRKVTKAINDRDYETFEELSGRHWELMNALADITKQAAPTLQPFVLDSAVKGSTAIDGLKGMTAVADALDRFPFTAEGFSRMSSNKVEKVAAAVDKFIKEAPEELVGQKQALASAVDSLAEGAGLKLELEPGQKLRATYEALKGSKTKVAKEAAEKIKSSGFGHSTAKYTAGLSASHAVRAAGGGVVTRSLAFEAGSKLVNGLLSLKTGVLGTLTSAAQKWQPAALHIAKVGKFIGPKIDPLKVRLDGTLEEADKPRKQLMEARMREMREAAPTIRDTLYRGVEPVAVQHTEFAAQMHNASVAMFDALMARMPRDPGLAFSRMKSLWTPDAVMTEQFARAYEVFHNPVGVAVRWLSNPRSITPEGASAMKQFNPELWTHLRVEMIQRLGEPGVLDKMTYSEQVGLGQLLDLRIHSTQDPRFIQAQQAMYQQRKETLPARPSAGNNSNNPSGTSKGMTGAQRITEH